ncbi:MAG: hypothetical protein KF708_13090 [Pirellulales bacterium]|nr:hypothetical protein [Pirellulales bacterium]
MASLSRLVSMLVACVLAAQVPSVWGQAPESKVAADAPPPPVTYHGLIPGKSTAADVRAALGSPVWEAPWYAYKLLYPAQGRSGMYDSVHLTGKDGHFACVEAASVPAGLATRAEIETRLGAPEYELRMATFKLLDYSQQGVRFIVDKKDQTIGVAYFPHLRPRVHDGARQLVDLSLLRQGPQPRPAEPASTEGLRAGAAEIKITPLQAEWLDPRYREKYQPHDDLYARAVLFERGDERVALVGADLFGLGLTTVEPIIERVKEAGIAHLVLAASHNHAAPDTMGVYGHYPAEYNQYIQDQVVKCVQAAYANLRPVKELRTASRELPMDGARVAGLIRNARNVGLVDPTISILQPIGEDDQPIATLVNFACHVEGIEAGVLELTADFPGYMCEQIKADGGGIPVFLNGAVGGMVSGDNRARTHDEAKATGLAFAALVKDLEKTAQPPATFDFAVETKRVEIPMTNANFKPLYEQMRPLNRGRVVTQMTLVRLGECEMVTLPGEVLPEVAVEILEHMHGFPRILIGLANDQLGYIIPPEDFRDDEYEETMSQGPAAAPVVRDTAIRMLKGIK